MAEKAESSKAGEGAAVFKQLRFRTVVTSPSALGKPKRKRPRPKRFKPSKPLQEEIQRLALKYTPKAEAPSESDIDEAFDLDAIIDNWSPSSTSTTSIPEFPKSSPSRITRTPKVVHHSDSGSKSTVANNEVYVAMANLALEYYNYKEDANLELQKVTAASEDVDYVLRMHINFLASTHDHSPRLFFAELINEHGTEESDLLGIHVQGCCVIEKVDSGNPLGRCCMVCNGVKHPGPAYGYRVVSGDAFLDYNFQKYISSAYDTLSSSKMMQMEKPPEWEMYVVSANKALQYFNSKQGTEFKDAEFTAGADDLSLTKGTEVHINFTARLLSGSQQELFFVVLSLPPFDIEGGPWEDCKEPFLKVDACCRLEKLDSGNGFGRVCGLCINNSFGTVIHPSPRDGHRSADGDDFSNYRFMKIGTGIY